MADTVIIGGGIIGVATAYYLSQHQAAETVHLVETAEQLFASASGYAGGFLARDWFAAELAELGALSFELHQKLAEQHDGRRRWGYTQTTTLSCRVGEEEEEGGQKKSRGEDWLRAGSSRAEAAPAATWKADDVAEKAPAWCRGLRGSGGSKGGTVDVLADDGSTAQLDPLRLCHFLLQSCRDRGVQLHQPARVVSLGLDGDGILDQVVLEMGAAAAAEAPSKPPLPRQTLPCRRLIIAAGVWSPGVYERLFGPLEGGSSSYSLPISSVSGHSAVVQLPPPWSADVATETNDRACHALYASGPGLAFSPEMYARVGGTLYMAGLNSTTEPVPALSTDSVPHPAQLETLFRTCGQVLGTTEREQPGMPENTKIIRTGLCHRPVTPWGRPLVLRLPEKERLPAAFRTRPGADGGVFVAAGHGPWGINMSLGTGMVLAELAQGRPLSVDVSGLGFPQ